MTTRERFIPFRAGELIERLLRDPVVPAERREGTRAVAALVRALIHHDFHDRLERLKSLYAPFDPDSDTKAIDPPAGDAAGRRAALLDDLSALLERANYRRLTGEDLQRALSEESMFQVRLHTELDDFAELVLFCRGSAEADEERKALFGLRKVVRRVDYYQRVAIYTRFKEADHFAAKGRKRLPFKPGSSILKLFQNIPKADLEMLFPNTDVRMKLGQRIMVGVPALAGGVVILATKLGASLLLIGVVVGYWIGLVKEAPQEIGSKELIALGLGIFALAGYLVRQINLFRGRRARFLKALADSLYFRNLDNNAGVFSRVVDEAEEEEAKEAVLAYVFLLAAATPPTTAELDAAIESWLKGALGADCDFEIDDGIAKLERLRLIERVGDRWRAVPVDEARRRLDERWDGLYTAA